ncbi:hypothetical protein [Nonomuraea polychroma]|nr:hypothetical protein [Nonomuraea polychroma]
MPRQDERAESLIEFDPPEHTRRRRMLTSCSTASPSLSNARGRSAFHNP